MRAGETLVDENNVEVCLFPLEYMYISQGEGGSYSHQGRWAIDFLGWDENGRKYHCPYYAPCSCKVVQHGTYYNVWQSLNQVITPSGKKYVTFVVMHDDTPPPLGTTVYQGGLIGHTGTATSPGGTPVTGDHVHMSGANGTFQGWINGGKDLRNREHLYNLFFVNDTTILDGFGYNWRIYDGGHTQGGTKYRFKWVLYANKLRERSVSNGINL